MVVSPPVRFIIVSRFSIYQPTFKSAVTLLCRTGFPAIIRTLILGHIMPQIRLGVVISLLGKWWACSAAVAALNSFPQNNISVSLSI